MAQTMPRKPWAIITLALVIGGFLNSFVVPQWVILICATMIAMGTMLGGWRLIRTLGGKFYKIRPVDGFSSQLASATVILGASLVGGPVSTTQVVSSSIMGVGAAERVNKVRWGVAQGNRRCLVVDHPVYRAIGCCGLLDHHAI